MVPPLFSVEQRQVMAGLVACEPHVDALEVRLRTRPEQPQPAGFGPSRVARLAQQGTLMKEQLGVVRVVVAAGTASSQCLLRLSHLPVGLGDQRVQLADDGVGGL